MFDKKELVEKLNELSPRELDVLVGRHVYGKEIKIERVDSNNKNNIKYLWVPDKKRKYTRNFSKSRTKTERMDSKFRPLPRWSSDIRDCWSIVKLINKKFGVIDIKVLDNMAAFVVLLGQTFEGNLCTAVTKAVLYFTFLEKDKL